MEIVHKGNKLNEPEPELSCECSQCGSAFIFKCSEIYRPREAIRIPLMSEHDTKEYIKQYYKIACPVCGAVIGLDKCNLLRNNSDKENFILLHTVEDKENN